jgi:hypothetical protein
MFQVHSLNGTGNPFRFVPVKGFRPSMFDITELTSSSADISQKQEGSSAITPAFTPVGAESFLADSVQSFRLH